MIGHTVVPKVVPSVEKASVIPTLRVEGAEDASDPVLHEMTHQNTLP